MAAPSIIRPWGIFGKSYQVSRALLVLHWISWGLGAIVIGSIFFTRPDQLNPAALIALPVMLAIAMLMARFGTAVES